MGKLRVLLTTTAVLLGAFACASDGESSRRSGEGLSRAGSGGTAGTAVEDCAAKAPMGCADADGCCSLEGNTVAIDEARKCRLQEAEGVLAGCALSGSMQFKCMFSTGGYCYQRSSGGVTTFLLSIHGYYHGIDPASGWKQCADLVDYGTAKAFPACLDP